MDFRRKWVSATKEFKTVCNLWQSLNVDITEEYVSAGIFSEKICIFWPR